MAPFSSYDKNDTARTYQAPPLVAPQDQLRTLLTPATNRSSRLRLRGTQTPIHSPSPPTWLYFQCIYFSIILVFIINLFTFIFYLRSCLFTPRISCFCFPPFCSTPVPHTRSYTGIHVLSLPPHPPSPLYTRHHRQPTFIPPCHPTPSLTILTSLPDRITPSSLFAIL